MARRLDEAIVQACRVPYQPGALGDDQPGRGEAARHVRPGLLRPADGATPLHAAAFVGDAQACRAAAVAGADPALADARPDALRAREAGASCRCTALACPTDALQNRDAAYD